MLSTNVKIPEEDHAELLKLARVGERTLAGEIRLAIRRHISAENVTPRPHPFLRARPRRQQLEANKMSKTEALRLREHTARRAAKISGGDHTAYLRRVENQRRLAAGMSDHEKATQ